MVEPCCGQQSELLLQPEDPREMQLGTLQQVARCSWIACFTSWQQLSLNRMATSTRVATAAAAAMIKMMVAMAAHAIVPPVNRSS